MSTIHAANRTITTAERIAGFLKPVKDGNPIIEVAKVAVSRALKGEGIDVTQLSADLKIIHKPLAPLAKIPEPQAEAFEKFFVSAKPYASPIIRRIVEQFKTLKRESVDFILEQLEAAHQGNINLFKFMANPKLEPIKEFANKLYPDLKKLISAINYAWGDKENVNQVQVKAFAQSLLEQVFPATMKA